MKVGILGSGDVARTLARGFLGLGDRVMMGTREASKLSDWQHANPKATVGSVADAAAFGELIVLAVNGTAALSVLEAAGKATLAGKVVIDVTNPIAPAPPDHGMLMYFTSLDESLLRIT